MTWPLTCSLPCFFSAKSTKISLSLFQLSAFLLSPLLPPSNSTFKNLTSTLLIACPGLTQEMLDYEIQVIREFVKNHP
jgi:hypothetical protein